MPMGVSVTMIQSVREKELHLLQQPPHPAAVVRGLKRLLPSRLQFSTSPSRVRGFPLLLPRAHTSGSPDRHRSEHPSALKGRACPQPQIPSTAPNLTVFAHPWHLASA